MTSQHDIPEESLLPPPDKLQAHHRRQLSAMMDGELSPDAARFMLRRLEHDDDLAGCWERWQVCGDVLRGQRSSLLPADFPQRVAAGLAEGARAGRRAPPPVAVPRARRARWGGSAALAASVAVVAFLVARQLPGDGMAPAEPAPTTVAARAPAAPAPAVSPAAPAPVPGGGYVADAAPVASPDDEAAVALAAGALAAVERPRRAAERRSQAQQARRAAPRAVARNIEVAPPVAAGGGALPLLADLPDAAAGAGIHPFSAQPVAPARPWPRAVLPGTLGTHAFSAGYGDTIASYDPFRPRVQPLLQPSPLSGDARADHDAPVAPADGLPRVGPDDPDPSR